MTSSSLEYVLRETFSSFKRNVLLSLASILTVFVSLVILGFSIFVMANANNMANSIESQLEISVFMDKEITEEQLAYIKTLMEKMPAVASVELVTKEQALRDFEQSMGGNQYKILENLGGVNPLPDKFTVKITDPQQVMEVAAELERFPRVERVRYGQELVEKLLSFTRWLRWIGIVVIAAFTIASVVLISINIKLNVFSRRREIQIMKLVGASDAFIRWPFLLEGLLIGFIGGMMAALVVGFGYNWLVNSIMLTLTFMPIVHDATFFGQVLTGLIVAGMMIGALGSVFSLRKFLRV